MQANALELLKGKNQTARQRPMMPTSPNPPKTRPRREKIDVEKRHVSYIDFLVVQASFCLPSTKAVVVFQKTRLSSFNGNNCLLPIAELCLPSSEEIVFFEKERLSSFNRNNSLHQQGKIVFLQQKHV